ncbi:MAG: serine/threonine-protein kinase [Chthoniobacteraceae bacterium]
MSEEYPPILQACPNCATLLDVSDQEPFAKVHCPICGTMMRARTQFNNFAIEEVLGRGGMGAVYRALDVNLNRMVALKVVKAEFSRNPEYVANFEREAVITASVNHPHVVKVFSFGADHGTYYIAMELVDKGSLDSLITLQERVAEAQVLSVGIQAAEGLNAAFKMGLIHRDVKPGNILFADAHTAKIVDFGLALLMEQEAEARGEIWGTPYYVAPEKLDGKPEDFRSDIYSLGGSLFHALAGRPPFEAETASMVALKHLKSRAVSLQAFAPDVSSATAYVINRMLNKDPDQRYQSYEELIEHLTYARTQLQEGKTKPRKTQRVVEVSKSQQIVANIIAVLIIALIVGLGYFGWKYRDKITKSNEPTADQVAADEKKQQAQDLNQQYDQLRRTMLGGDFSSAQQGFHNLQNGDTPLQQPMLNWATFHEGLCALLDGKAEDAEGIFQQVFKRGMFSTQEEQVELANFFVETSRVLSDNSPVLASALKGYGGSNLDLLSVLAFALKDWELGAFDDSNAYFTAFMSRKADDDHAWLEEYKALAKPYLPDLKILMDLEAEVAAANTPEAQATALQHVQSAKDSLQHGGKVLDAIVDMQVKLKLKSGAK